MLMIDKQLQGGGFNDDVDVDEQLVLGRMSGGGDHGAIEVVVEKEHMFDKVVTPSDVGKLNRLVIPKQHAEKYFPLDSSTNDKGLLLNFEDTSGKQWRFRYSYWNSSQSYVMTKGWSRFVKEKKLDAGDIVSFQRGRGVGDFGRDRLFIDWRRRLDHHHQQHRGGGPGGLSSSADDHHRLLLGSASTATDISLPRRHHQYLSGFQSRSSSNIFQHPAAAAAAAWNPLFLQQLHQQHPHHHMSSSAPHYFLQPHLLLPPAPAADHSLNNSTTTTNRHHSQSNFHYPNSHMTATYHPSAATYYHHHQVENSASADTSSCSGSVINFRSAAAAAATHQHFQQQQEQEDAHDREDVAMVHYLQRPGGVVGVDPSTRAVFESVPVIEGKAAAKRLRLFGVNMDCPINNYTSNSADYNNTSFYSPSSATSSIIEPAGISLAVSHHYTTASTHNTYHTYNSPSTATTGILPPPYNSTCFSSSSSPTPSIPYLQLSSHVPSASATYNLPGMLNRGKSTMSFDLDI